MKDITFVVIAACIENRFDGENKQLELICSSIEIIINYPIYDTLETSFSKENVKEKSKKRAI